MVTKQEEAEFDQLIPEELFQFPYQLDAVLTDITSNPGSFSLGLTPPRVEDEATMDVADANFEPVTQYGPPERNVFAGDLNFEVLVNSSDVHKRRYLYSSKMNRIYVDMSTNFSMQFVWDFQRAPRPMFVRATVVFSDEAQQEKRVDRCLQHKQETHPDNAGLESTIVPHVLRSTREAGAQGVYYCGDPTRPDSWLSVLVRHDVIIDPNTAAPAPSHAYQFVCKNSCSTGINRRSIAVLFTLEDCSGRVAGRQLVGVRVCSCPRRDMLKDEEAAGAFLPGKKRVAGNRLAPAAPAAPAPAPAPAADAKRLKVEVLDDDEAVLTLPAGLQIVGGRTVLTGINVMINMMEQAASFKKNDPRAQDKYTRAVAGLRSFADKLAKDKSK